MIASWVPEPAYLSKINLTYPTLQPDKTKKGEKIEQDMDGLPHLIFVVVEPDQAQLYLDHLKGHPFAYPSLCYLSTCLIV